MKSSIISILFFWVTNIMFSQTIATYQFKDYKTPKFVSTKKAALDFTSNKTAKLFKTAITQSYKTAKIDFASYYTTVIWGCGTGCINGAMVDVRDGKVYDLPLDFSNAYSGCFANATNDDKEDRYEINKNSSLFITRICEESDAKKPNQKLQTKTYFVNIWNEKTKKFKLEKKVIVKETIKITGY
jgi:hypothetical protein